jgi:hypothetical protein
MTDPGAIREFVLAGSARFTIVSVKTGTRFTYRVRDPDGEGRVFFVSLLTGQDNETNFSFFATIFADDGALRHGRTGKAKVDYDAPSARAFRWFYEVALPKPELPPELEFYHDGHCARCGRALTVPESVARGLGPECAKRAG